MRVTYSFVSSGADDIRNAFRSVTVAAKESAAAAARSGQAGATGARAAKSELSAEVAEMRKVVAMRNQESAAALKQSRAAGSAFDAKLKAQTRAAAAYEKNLIKQVAADEQAEKRKTDIAAREGAKRAKAERRANEKIAEERWDTFSKVGSRIAGAAAKVAMYGGGAAMGLIGAAARDVVQLGDTARRGSINAGLAGESVNADELQRRFTNAAITSPGVKANDVGDAYLAYQSKTGKSASSGMLDTFANVAQGSGADIKDVAEAAAALSTKFNITGIEEMRKALSTLVVQGAKGAFELKDAATSFDALTSAAARFGMKGGAKDAATLGGLTQLARGSTGSSEEATTSVESMFRDLITHGAKIEGQFGAKVFTDSSQTKARPIEDVLVDVISKSKGNLPALQKIFDARGVRAVTPLVTAYNTGHDAQVGNEAEKTAAGIRAMREAMADAIDATDSVRLVNEAAASAQQSTSARTTAAFELLQAKVASDLVPAIIPLVEKLPALVGALDPLITVLTDAVSVVGDFITALQEAGVISKSPGARKAKAQRELDSLNGMMTDRIGPASPAELAKKAQLEYEIGAMGSVTDSPPGVTTEGKQDVKGAAIGAAVGGAAFGPGGALGGAAFGYMASEDAIAQGKDYASERAHGHTSGTSGYIETESGGYLPLPKSNGVKDPDIAKFNTKEAQENLKTFSGALLAAAAKLGSVPTIGTP